MRLICDDCIGKPTTRSTVTSQPLMMTMRVMMVMMAMMVMMVMMVMVMMVMLMTVMVMMLLMVMVVISHVAWSRVYSGIPSLLYLSRGNVGSFF